MWWKRGKKRSPLSGLQLLFILLHMNHNHHLDLTPFTCWQVIAVHLLSKDAVPSIVIWTSSARLQVQKIPNNYRFQKPTPTSHQNLEVEKEMKLFFAFSALLFLVASWFSQQEQNRGATVPSSEEASFLFFRKLQQKTMPGSLVYNRVPWLWKQLWS